MRIIIWKLRAIELFQKPKVSPSVLNHSVSPRNSGTNIKGMINFGQNRFLREFKIYEILKSYIPLSMALDRPFTHATKENWPLRDLTIRRRWRSRCIPLSLIIESQISVLHQSLDDRAFDRLLYPVLPPMWYLHVLAVFLVIHIFFPLRFYIGETPHQSSHSPCRSSVDHYGID